MFDIRKIQEQVIFGAIQNAGNAETAANIVFGENRQSASDDDATWVKATMSRLEAQFDSETVKQIRMHCQCGYGMDERIALVQELVEASSNLQEFADQEKAKASGLFCVDGELYLQFPYCPCPMLADVNKLDSLTWCQCTTGYSKVLFEKAFGCQVDVELLKSVKVGDDVCLMKIIPRDAVWH